MKPKLILIFLAVAAGPALAGDAGLYAPPPPAGAASVRLVHARMDGKPANATIDDKILKASVDRPSRFVFVMQGAKRLSSGAYSETRPITAGSYYSLVATNTGGREKLYLITEPKPPLSRALVVFYNLTGRSGVSLKTGDGSTIVVDPVGKGGVGSRAVNPLKTGFAVFQGGRKLGAVPPVQLQRGSSYGVFLLPGAPARVIAAPGPALGK